MTALGENVKLVAGSEVYGETLTDYTLQVDYELPLGKRAAEVPALGDSYPDEDAPWDYIVVETGSFTSGRGPARGAYLTGVKYAKVKTPYTSGISGLREAYQKFETGRRGRRMGTRIFYAADADAEGLVAASLVEGTPMGTSGGWAAALLRETTLERRWRVGLARITAVYDSYAESGELEPTGRGILEADIAAVRMWNTFKVDDHPVGVPFKDDASETRRRWAIIEGANAWPYVRAQLRIKVLLNTSQLKALAPLVGRVNSSACPKILGAGKHALWFNDLTLRQRKRAEGRRYDTIVYLMLDSAGWDAKTIAQLQEYRIDQTKVFEDDGETDTKQWQRMGVWVPVEGTDTEELLGMTAASFGVINAYL